MSTNIDRAVEVIRPLLMTRNLTYTVRAKKIARALDKLRLLAPKLPEPTTLAGTTFSVWRFEFDTIRAGHRKVHVGAYMEPLTPAEARILGLALLAAADRAGEVGTDE